MIYRSWDIEQNMLKLVTLDHFLPFNPLKTPKTKLLKNEKICWRYHHFTCVPKNHNILCMVPEIRSEIDIIFALLPNPPSPTPLSLIIPKKIFLRKTWKKCLQILSFYTYMCIINEGHMIHGSWNIKFDRNSHHFGPFFAFSTPWQPGKSKF